MSGQNMAAYMAEDRGPRLQAATTVVVVFSTIAIALRLWSRAVVTQAGFWWDDWTALLAWAFSIGNCATAYYWVSIGFGKHMSVLLGTGTTPKQVLLVLFAQDFTYNIGISLAKLSALLFYARIFNKVRWFRWALWLTATLVVSWGITFSLLAIFTCQPIHKQWDEETPGHCLESGKTFVAAATPNIVIDAIIVLLPMPLIRKLQINTAKKVGLLITFVVGYSAIIVSIIRVASEGQFLHSHSKDITWALWEPETLYIIEIPIIIVSICLPTISSLYRRALGHGFTSLFTSKERNQLLNAPSTAKNGFPSRPANSQGKGFAQVEAASSDISRENLFQRTSTSGNRAASTAGDLDVPLGEIQVRRDIEIAAERNDVV